MSKDCTMPTEIKAQPLAKKPKWLRVKLPTGKKYTELRGLVDKYDLHTICTSGSCPNMGECWGEGTATFMILGNVCTRSCGFCGVKTGRPDAVDWEEPEKVANSIKIMKIKHAVLTSVDRDDLKDMGTLIWTETIKSIRRLLLGLNVMQFTMLNLMLQLEIKFAFVKQNQLVKQKTGY